VGLSAMFVAARQGRRHGRSGSRLKDRVALNHTFVWSARCAGATLAARRTTATDPLLVTIGILGAT
jgi:hypothetical protein